MKRIMSSILVLCLTISMFCVSVSAEYVAGTIEFEDSVSLKLKQALESKFNNDEINIVFLGGSITEGIGASVLSSTSWASLVGNTIKNTMTDKVVNCYNYGISDTTSQFGMYRTTGQVKSKNPDLVFIEYAVNDRYNTESAVNPYYESMVRNLSTLDKPPYIIFVYSASLPTENTNSVLKAQSIAEYYNVAEIDLYDYFYATMLPQQIDKYKSAENYWNNAQGVDTARRDVLKTRYTTVEDCIESMADKSNLQPYKLSLYPQKKSYYLSAEDEWSGDEKWTKEDVFWMKTLLGDDVHPIDAGYYGYAKHIIELFANEPDKYLKKTVVPDSNFSETVYNNADLIPYNYNTIYSSGWQTANGSVLKDMEADTYLKTGNLGETATIYFKGNTFGLVGYVGGAGSSVNGGTVSCVIDGENVGNCIEYHPGHTKKTDLKGFVQLSDAGWHKAVITTIEPRVANEDFEFSFAYTATNADYGTPKVEKILADGTELEIVNSRVEMPIGTESVQLVFDGYPDLGTVNKDTVLVKINGVQTECVIEYDIDSRTCNIKLPKKTEDESYEFIVTPQVTYNGNGAMTKINSYAQNSINLSGLKFRTLSGAKISAVNDVEEGIKVSVDVKSLLDKNTKICLISVLKNKNGIIKKVMKKSNTISNQNTEFTLTTDLKYDNIADGDYLESYVWLEDNIYPVTEKITFSFTELEMVGGDKSILSFYINDVKKSAKLIDVVSNYNNSDTLTIKGKADNAEFVTLKLVNQQGRIIAIGQTKVIDGEFTKSIKTADIGEDGVYTLFIQTN